MPDVYPRQNLNLIEEKATSGMEKVREILLREYNN